MQRIVCIFLSTIGAYYGAKKQAQIRRQLMAFLIVSFKHQRCLTEGEEASKQRCLKGMLAYG
jgi:hypothetical protein